MVQRTLGAVMVATAVAVAADLDVRFQTALADELPAFVTNPTRGARALGRGRGSPGRAARALALRGERDERTASAVGGPPGAGQGARLRGQRPLVQHAGQTLRSTWRDCAGRVVLIDFWTYTCINCMRTLPYLRAWDGRYRDRGLTIVGVHTPEFAFERETRERRAGDRATTGCATRLPRTTTSRPGARGAISTGPRST